MSSLGPFAEPARSRARILMSEHEASVAVRMRILNKLDNVWSRVLRKAIATYITKPRVVRNFEDIDKVFAL